MLNVFVYFLYVDYDSEFCEEQQFGRLRRRLHRFRLHLVGRDLRRLRDVKLVRPLSHLSRWTKGFSGLWTYCRFFFNWRK